MAKSEDTTAIVAAIVVFIVSVKFNQGPDKTLFVDIALKGDEQPLPIADWHSQDKIGSKSLTGDEWDKLLQLLIDEGAKLALVTKADKSKSKAINLADYFSSGKKVKSMVGKDEYLSNVKDEGLALLKISYRGYNVNKGQKCLFINLDASFQKYVEVRARKERRPGLDW